MWQNVVYNKKGHFLQFEAQESMFRNFSCSFKNFNLFPHREGSVILKAFINSRYKYRHALAFPVLPTLYLKCLPTLFRKP